MPNARNAQHVDYVNTFLNMSLNAAGLGIQGGSGAATFATANTVKYLIDGVFKSKAAAATQSLVTTSLNNSTGAAYAASDITVPVNSTGYFLVCVDAAGNLKTFVGVASLPNGTLSFTGALPDYPAGYAPLGYMKVVTTSAPFVPGTTLLDAATYTITFVDIAMGGLTVAP